SGGAGREPGGLARLPAVGPLLPVARDDEDRIVDPDRQAQHGGQRGGGLGEPEGAADRQDPGAADAHGEQRDQQRKSRGGERAEGDQQDQRRGRDADDLGGAAG